jgi:hypothetical protein
MLVGAINPVANFVNQQNPFGTPVTTTANLISIKARPYVAGGSSINFEVNFISATVDASGNVSNMQNVSSSPVTLTSTELATWGVDDTVLFNLVAAKLGTGVTVTATYTVQDQLF